jgi:hypothetical protein
MYDLFFNPADEVRMIKVAQEIDPRGNYKRILYSSERRQKRCKTRAPGK